MASGSYSNAYKGYTVKTNWSSTANVEGNYSTVTCTHYLICGSGWDLYIGSRTTNCTAGETKSCTISGISTGGGTTHTLGTTTHKVNHNSDGKKTVSASTTFNIQATISGSYVSSITATGTMVLDEIARASTLTVNDGTLGTAQNLKITRASDSFTHKLEYACGSTSGVILSNTSSVNLAWTPPITLASQNTTGESVSIIYTLTTYNGSTTVGTSKATKNYKIPDSVKPTCSVSVSDPTGYATTYGGYVQGMSKFQVSVTATTSYGSPISSYKTTANGSTYNSSSFTTGVISNSGTATITGTVTDKRGRSGNNSITATVLEYSKPKITKLSVNRCDFDGTENMQGEYVKVTYSCSVSSLNSKNTLASVVKYKKTTESSYTSQTDIETSTITSYTDRTITIPADSGSSYNIEVDVTDVFDTTAKVTNVSTAFTFMHFVGSNTMGLGKLAEFEGGLDIGFQTRFATGLKFPLLKAETDLDDVRTPNFYVGENLTTYNYTNCPLLSGTFYLEVVAMGDSGQVRQRITSCSKTNSVTYERIYYQGEWGDWRDCYVGEEVIYDNSTGNSGTVTLTTAASQYIYIEIFYYYGGSYFSSVKVYNPNGKKVNMVGGMVNQSTSAVYLSATTATISGTSITPNYYGEYTITSSSFAFTTNRMFITRVVGYR